MIWIMLLAIIYITGYIYNLYTPEFDKVNRSEDQNVEKEDILKKILSKLSVIIVISLLVFFVFWNIKTI